MPEFFTTQWADAVREAVNREPDPEYVATKLQMYWDWIAQARKTFDGSVAFGVAGRDEHVRLTFEAGVCSEASVVPDPQATFVLTGRPDDWRDIMGGFDTNKAIMYRKLLLSSGDVFSFFNRVYFFAEALACVAKVPTTFKS